MTINARPRTLLLLGLLVAASGCGYNRIQALDEQVSANRANIDAELMRRNDLIPNLVATVKGYAQHEQAVFDYVAKAREALLAAHSPSDRIAANNQLDGALGRLLAVVENYPQLKANENFLSLQDELAGTENRIAVARRRYNLALQDYNAYIGYFPNNLVAGWSGFQRNNAYFEASPAAQRVPQVNFGTPAPTQSQKPAQPPKP